MKLLISGSRDASVKMLEMAWNTVHEMYLHGHQIVVGDAQGVDYRVIQACRHFGIKWHCYGISEKGRFPQLIYPSRYSRVDIPEGTHPKRAYLIRDEFMANEADEGMFIWDGKSGGTKYTHDYMKKLGKQVKLYDFSFETE